MASKYDSVKCKSCARVLAVVSATGLVPTTSPDASHAGCSTCQRFDSLYDAIREADTEWAVLENKRDSISKSFARDNHKRAHMEFDNWLMTVEAPGPARDAQNEHPENKDHGGGDSINDDKQDIDGPKRRRSHSPTTQRSGESSDTAPHGQQGISLSLRPSPKRSHSSSASISRKRLKFSDSVEFHENYRTSEQYHRPSETYARGRNAPPEGSEYMDTSGSGLTFLKFTGTKKVGAKWVELSEEELAKQSEKAKTWAQLRKLATAGKSKADTPEADAEVEVRQDDDAPQDARAARLARRAKGTSAESVQARGTTSRRGRGTLRKGKQPSLVSAVDDVPETACDSTLVSNTTTTAHGNDHHSDGDLGRVEIIASGDDGLERRHDAVPRTETTAALGADQVREPATPHEEPHRDMQVTSEAMCQSIAAQPNTSSVESQPTVVSGNDQSQLEPRKNALCTDHDAPEIEIPEASSGSRILRPTSSNLEDTGIASARDLDHLSDARPNSEKVPARKEDAVREDPGVSTQNTPTAAEKAIATGTSLQQPSAEREDLVSELNTSTSADNKLQVQGHSNVDIASATIPQDPDRPPAARMPTEEA
ncbi:uncharacterized protein J4E92_004948 [Alternaria infectoria]|uniref:uncharacterized protein n=1 Tax=Alternaria infectoria TaxID=45303 RepID=UPI00221F395A|nr:uncharacterized protein J4E92_004948 [Alternaria infectoria]KAI4929284.1 hypothetical protein J4E92_004948 [Alternaria infectoria]